MKLVSNAKSAWRWFSIQAMALAGAMQGAWIAVPDDLKGRVPADLVDMLTLAILAFGIVGRLVDQGSAE